MGFWKERRERREKERLNRQQAQEELSDEIKSEEESTEAFDKAVSEFEQATDDIDAEAYEEDNDEETEDENEEKLEEDIIEDDEAEADELDSETFTKKTAEEAGAAQEDVKKTSLEEAEAASKDAMTEQADGGNHNTSEKVAQEEAEAAQTEEYEKQVDAEQDQTQEKKGFWKRLFSGMTKTRNNFGFGRLFRGHSKIDEDFYEDLEEVLVMGDIGVRTTENILDRLREQVKEQKIREPAECRQILIDSIREQMQIEDTAYRFEEETSVVMMIGVNGVGKTTTIGKLAAQLKGKGRKVILAAADTFRAAAGEQLNEWANRAGVDIIGGQEGADPGSVLYDAVAAAKSRHADVLICDTAGRLQNKKNLMAELEKMNRILKREYPDAYRETLVVLDATTGQNALSQAREFNEVTDITGIVLTKMDGTAKGGIAVAIQSELGIPVKYIGVGESIDDLQKFDPDRFVEALFEQEEE